MNATVEVKSKTESLARLAFSLYMNEIDETKYNEDLQRFKKVNEELQELISQLKFESSY